jgi:hypothetical protein
MNSQEISKLKGCNVHEIAQLHHDATDFQLLVLDYAWASLKAYLELAG